MQSQVEGGYHEWDIHEGNVLVWRLNDQGPESIVHEGKTYHRFMDVFYVSEIEIDRLSLGEVISLCRARELNCDAITGTNEKVKRVFRSAIAQLSPGVVWEIGAGARPLFLGNEQFLYLKSDADLESMSGQEGQKFCFSENESRVGVDSGTVDVAVAVFVLQFNFYSEQIDEIIRCLSPGGIFLANVYRRTPASRSRLKSQFLEKGLVLEVIPDPKQLCRDHEYWIVSKDVSSSRDAVNVIEAIVRADTSD